MFICKSISEKEGTCTMEERIGEAFAFNELLTAPNRQLLPGETAPDFSLDYLDLADMTGQSARLADVVENIHLFNDVNSLARMTCNRVTQHWEKLQAKHLENVKC